MTTVRPLFLSPGLRSASWNAKSGTSCSSFRPRRDLTSTPITTTELCRILQGRYEVEPHLLAQDLDEVLGQLGNAELLVGLDGSPSSTAVRTEPVEDLENLVSSYHQAAAEYGLLASLQLALTNACNLACVHCYERLAPPLRELPVVEVLRCVTAARDLGLLKIILHNFTGYNVPKAKEDVLMGIERFLRDTMQDGKHVVIAIDEAQLINDESVFEELRLLMNFQTETRFLLTLILSGQPELKEKLDSNKQFSQRVTLSYHLKPLDFEETRKYVLHRLEVAGLTENIFEEKAMELLYERSGGIPRWINNIANMSMLAAFSKGEKIITEDLVIEGVESGR